MATCENCGCKVYNGRCTNCHEELFILDQYYELGMKLPAEDSPFMQNVERAKEEIERKKHQTHE
jgi:hypothetical protein